MDKVNTQAIGKMVVARAAESRATSGSSHSSPLNVGNRSRMLVEAGNIMAMEADKVMGIRTRRRTT